MDWGLFLVQTLVTSVLSGSIVGLVLKSLLDRRMEKHRFTRDWKEKSLTTLVGPVFMHLNRTKHGAARYKKTFAAKTTSFLEAGLLRDSNEAVRSLLLSHGHLLPEELRTHAHALVAHYDVWLRRFDAKVAVEKPDVSTATFDVGFAEVPFPEAAEEAFRTCYETLRGGGRPQPLSVG
jgi:hypothetical protein